MHFVSKMLHHLHDMDVTSVVEVNAWKKSTSIDHYSFCSSNIFSFFSLQYLRNDRLCKSVTETGTGISFNGPLAIYLETMFFVDAPVNEQQGNSV